MGQKKARLALLSDIEKELIEILNSQEKLRNQCDNLQKKPKKLPNDIKKIKRIKSDLKKLSSNYTTLLKNLINRFEAFNEDFKRILDSKKLVSDLKQRGLLSFIGLTSRIWELSLPTFEKAEEEAEQFPDYSTWRVFEVVKNRHKKYWLSINEIPTQKFSVKDTTSPNYAISGIKGTWPAKLPQYRNGKWIEVTTQVNVRKILFEALDLMKRFPNEKIIPIIAHQDQTDEEEIFRKSRSIIGIKARIEKFKEALRKKERTQVTETVYKGKEAQKLLKELRSKGIKIYQRKTKT